jgi:hypothetical protein
MNQFFKDSELKAYLPKFLEIYKKRPIKNNVMGMGINHSFALYSLLKKLNIEHVFESGIALGHSTWLIEKTLENVDLTAVDLNLELREYVSKNKNTKYHEGDIEDLAFDNLDPNKTIVFFDDHTNVMHRLKFLKAWGIKYAIFEDNYPPGHGDSYSIRKIRNHSGQPITDMVPNYEYKNKFDDFKFIPKSFRERVSNANTTWPYFLTHYYHVQNKLRNPNTVDEILFDKIVKEDYEIQPIYLYEKQRWGATDWEGKYKSLKPLFENLDDSEFSSDLKLFEKESPQRMFNYVYFSFVELRT